MKSEQILRITVTIGALLVAFARLVWPDLKIDIVTLGLIALAILPWVAPLIKSIEIPGVGKVELREMQRHVEEAKGAAENAARQSELALAALEPSAAPRVLESMPGSVEDDLWSLASGYNHIRATQRSGNTRTSAMTSIVSRMIELAPRLSGFDARTALTESDAGKRLAAYAYLYSRPDTELLNPLVETVTEIENQPFGQYWGLQAISVLLGQTNEDDIPMGAVRKLERFSDSLPRGSDRGYVLGRILRDLQRDAAQE